MPVFAALCASCVLSLAPSVAAADDPPIESPESDPRVILTDTLSLGGFEEQDAHRVAVLMTDGIDIAQIEPILCQVYLVNVYWCEMAAGHPTKKSARLRLDASCFGSFFPPGDSCLGMQCPPGQHPFYKMFAGGAGCNGVPAGACCWVDITGPVDSVCWQLADCSCLPGLADLTCDDLVECVPAIGAGGLWMPSDCPSCE